MNNQNKFYHQSAGSEIEKLEQGKFTGNIEIQFNFKEGSIKNINVVLRKAIFATEQVNN